MAELDNALHGRNRNGNGIRVYLQQKTSRSEYDSRDDILHYSVAYGANISDAHDGSYE